MEKTVSPMRLTTAKTICHDATIFSKDSEKDIRADGVCAGGFLWWRPRWLGRSPEGRRYEATLDDDRDASILSSATLYPGGRVGQGKQGFGYGQANGRPKCLLRLVTTE